MKWKGVEATQEISKSSNAKVETGSLTGKLMYRIADKFYVQWREMLNVFPKAIFKGGIY